MSIIEPSKSEAHANEEDGPQGFPPEVWISIVLFGIFLLGTGTCVVNFLTR